MAFTVGQISAPITADDSGFNTTLNRAERRGKQAGKNISASFDRVGRSFQRTGAVLTASVTAPLILGARKAVREFALLEGAMAKFNVVFGDQAEEVEAWVNEFREGVPLARREIVQHAAAMQDLLVPMGIARKEATGMSKDWLELAAALAAFNDVPVDQALEAIRSGIAGQSRPLRQFGIDVRETALEQTALEAGLIKAGEAMGDQARQQALLIQATKQSADAINGYEDQLGSTLMAEQELQASFKDTLAVFGQDLQPAYNDFISTLTGVVKWIADLDEGQRKAIITAGKWALALGPGLTALGTMARLLPTVTKGMRGLTAAMMANPYLAVGAAVLALASHLFLVNKRASDLNKELDSVLNGDLESRTLSQLNELITQMDAKVAKFRNQLESMGVDPEAYEVFQDMNAELDQLISKRDQLAGKQLDSIISEDDSKTLVDWNAKAEETVRRISAIKESFERIPPLDKIIGFEDDNTLNTFDEINASIKELMQMTEGYDFSDRIFPEGSLGALQERMDVLREKMRFAFDPEVQKRIREEMELTQAQINSITGATNETEKASRVWGENLTTQLSQAVLHGRNLEEILKNIGKQLASRAIVQGISMLAGGGFLGGADSFLGGVFGGLFHSGGIVPGSGERTIQVRGGEGVFTAGQMKAMGIAKSSGGSSISAGQMERAFDRALSKHTSKLGADEIFTLSQKGRLGY